jgi:hypothetical protein
VMDVQRLVETPFLALQSDELTAPALAQEIRHRRVS